MNTPTPPRHSNARIPAPIARISRTRWFRGFLGAGTGPGTGPGNGTDGWTGGGGGGFGGCTRTRLVRCTHRSAVDAVTGALADRRTSPADGSLRPYWEDWASAAHRHPAAGARYG